MKPLKIKRIGKGIYQITPKLIKALLKNKTIMVKFGKGDIK